MHFLSFALCAFSAAAGAQEDPLVWFPLQVGSRWVYEHEWKSGDRVRPNVDRWTTEETITAWVRIPEGLVVLRAVKQRSDASKQTAVRPIPQSQHSAYIVTRDREPYLIHGNCLYVIGDGWDSQAKQLRPSYRAYLTKGALSPDFCFPLETRRNWGNNDIPWRVEPVRNEMGSFLPAEYHGATHLFSSHFGSGGREDVWFKKGVGVVAEHYTHNGTYDDYTKKLATFSH